jgi:hypothetical protein
MNNAALNNAGLVANSLVGMSQGGLMSGDGIDEELRTRAEELTRKIKARMSPAGALALDPLLDQRRLEFGLPDGMFKAEPLFDRVFVWQPPDNATETFVSDGRIVRPDSVQDRDRRAMPRGILVGAGLVARDVLLAHGIQLGAMVRFIRLAPWSMEVDNIDGQSFEVLVMKVGDLTGCEDLRASLVSKRQRIGIHKTRHAVLSESGEPTAPERDDVETPEDY